MDFRGRYQEHTCLELVYEVYELLRGLISLVYSENLYSFDKQIFIFLLLQ
jgi:hypothetical protein